jgi:CelD/BcsL family acetyltransferase involved in cellulose biosynthesis
MRARLLPLTDVQQGELGRWRELAAAALEPNPFFEPDYVLPLARGLGELGEVALAVVTDRDSWVACCPVRRLRRWHRIPLPSMSVWQGHTLYSLLGTPLISRDQTHAATVALVELLVRSPTSFFTAFYWLAEHGPVHRAVGDALAETGLRSLRFEQFERAFLPRRPDGAYLEQSMSAPHRRELRRQSRKLGELLGSEPELVDRSGEACAVTEFVELEGRSYLAARGSVLKSDRRHVEFFREMCAGFAALGRLQLLVLRAGDRTLAMKCNLVAGPGVFSLKIAYDEGYARFSPGIQLETEALVLFHDQPNAGWMDSCADPNNAMMNRLWPARRSLVTVAALEPRPRALVTAPAIRGARYLRTRMIVAHDEPAA